MKKTWYLIVIILILTLAAGWLLSRKSGVDVSNTSKLQIVVSLPLLQNLAEEIGRDEVVVESIINGPSCNHEFEPASGDLIKVSRSALFIKVGLGFDLWADKLAKNAGAKISVIDASHGVTVIKDEAGEDGELEAENGRPEAEHHHELGNPHYWGNPDNVKIMAKNIFEGLSKVLPEKKAYFHQNYQAYLLKIDQTSAELKAELNQVATKKIVSYSAAFPYLFEYFGLDNQETVETTCEQEVSPKRLAEVITDMKANGIKVVVGEAVYPRLPENLAKETGAKLVLLWPSTNETGDYLGTLKENIKKLVSVLQ